MEKHFNVFLWVVGLALPLIWLLDAPWINDEPMLFKIALDAIEDGKMASHGLQGTFGVYYGALPARFYQLLLLITSNVGIILLIKVLLSVVATLWLFGRFIRKGVFPKSAAVLVLFSPYLFFYHRVLWDNCFLIPLSLLWFYLTVSWFDRPANWKLSLLGFSFAMGLEIHLMSVLTVVPLAALIIWRARKPLPLLALFCGGVLGLLPGISYWIEIPKVFLENRPAAEGWRAEQLLVAVGGARWFTPIDFYDHFLPEASRWIVKHSSRVFYFGLLLPSLLVLWWYLRGLFLEGRRWWGAKEKWEGRQSFLFLVFALPLLCHFLFFNLSPKGHHPHYYNVCWLSFLYFIGCALAENRRRERIAVVYGLYLLVFTTSVLSWVHHFRGSREFGYGTTLRNQRNIIRQRVALAPTVPVEFKNRQYQQFPHAFLTLERLEKKMGVTPVPQVGSHPISKISVDYFFPESEKNSKLILKFEQATGP